MIEIQAAFPVMVTPELAAVKQFYQEVFGFTAVFHEPGFYLHLVSPGSGAQLGFLAPGHATQPDFLHPVMTADGYVITLEVADAARAYEQAKSMDLDFAMGLKEESWGQIHFMLEGPAGFRVDVVEHVEVPDDQP